MKGKLFFISIVLLVAACSTDRFSDKDSNEQNTETYETETDSDSVDLEDCEGALDFTPCDVVTEPDRTYDVCIGSRCVSPGCGDATCNTPKPHFQMSTSEEHDAFELVDGTEPIVQDIETGLEWTGCFVGVRGVECEKGAVERKSWDKAIAYCDALNWGGFADWHLPDPYELISLADYGVASSNRLPDVFMGTGELLSLWTAATDACSEKLAWWVGFEKAERVLSATPKDVELPVLCTRGAAGGTQPRRRVLSIDKEPVVQDEIAGKIWMGCSFGLFGENCEEGQSWFEDRVGPALYQDCQELNWSDREDWRLPSVKEMISVMDYTVCDPAINDDDFPNHEMSYYWTSTPKPDGVEGWVWYISTYDGGVGWEGAMFSGVMCIADM